MVESMAMNWDAHEAALLDCLMVISSVEWKVDTWGCDSVVWKVSLSVGLLGSFAVDGKVLLWEYKLALQMDRM